MHGQSTAQNNRECGADGDLPTRPIYRPNGSGSSQPPIAGGFFGLPTADLTLAVQCDRLPTSGLCVNSPCSSSNTEANRGVGTTLTQ